MLAQLVIHSITLLERAGAIIDGIVCDGASTNRSMWRDLGLSGKHGDVRHFFQHPTDHGRRVFAFSDAHHLLKCVRNCVLQQRFLKVSGKWVKWTHYVSLFNADTSTLGTLRVWPKLTSSHIHLTNAGKMRVRYATQFLSNSVVHGLHFYSKRVDALRDCEGTAHFTKILNDAFDALNRRFAREGITLESCDFKVLRDTLLFLDGWEKELLDGHITREMFLTPSTAEGLRVTIHSTIDLCTYLLSSCNFKYVLTTKMNQDPVERFLVQYAKQDVRMITPVCQPSCNFIVCSLYISW